MPTISINSSDAFASVMTWFFKILFRELAAEINEEAVSDPGYRVIQCASAPSIAGEKARVELHYVGLTGRGGPEVLQVVGLFQSSNKFETYCLFEKVS